MHSDTVTIYCPNPLCQAPNQEGDRFCHQCRTALPRRYLWAIGKGMESRRSGELLAGRYRVKQDRIVLDTQPGNLPDSSATIAPEIQPYLRLAPYRLHVPQVYGLVKSSLKSDLVLLEQAPLYTEGVVSEALEPLEGQLMPALTTRWQESTSLRQLNWLWQIASLWEPLASEGVASTLLKPDLIRVEGGLVRLLALHPEGKTAATLASLGHLWQQWQPTAQPDISPFLGQLCQLLQNGAVRHAEQLVMLLDRALAACGRSQTRQLQIVTLTDQGPSRQRNEDACYPPGGTVWTDIDPAQTQPLVVVCDGIGGHEGGSVASNLAIDTVQQQVQALPAPLPDQTGAIDPQMLMLQLEQATLRANDVISQRNDNEQRQERQRMGTTLVLALARAHELYLAHVGDSRIYRITRLGCHQVTLDDDLASREVRLGYALYREALQQPGSGSLVQALGMSASTMLHPTVQRFVLDEDCVFLLCSDGLSDHDRVDEYWHSELIPLLDGKIDVATASQKLLAIANSTNGHDNVTIGLLHCQVTPTTSPRSAALLDVSLDVPGLGVPQGIGATRTTTPAATQILLPQKPSANPLLALLAFILVLGLGSAVAYVLFPGLRLWVDALLGLQPGSLPAPLVTPTAFASPESSPPVTTEALSVGSLIAVQRTTVEPTPTPEKPLVLWSQPELLTLPKSDRIHLGTIPAGSVLQIVSRQAIPDRGYWLQLKVCSVPRTATAATTPVLPSEAKLQPGQSGWIEQTTIAPLVTQNLGLTASQLGACGLDSAAPLAPTVMPTGVKPKG